MDWPFKFFFHLLHTLRRERGTHVAWNNARKQPIFMFPKRTAAHDENPERSSALASCKGTFREIRRFIPVATWQPERKAGTKSALATAAQGPSSGSRGGLHCPWRDILRSGSLPTRKLFNITLRNFSTKEVFLFFFFMQAKSPRCADLAERARGSVMHYIQRLRTARLWKWNKLLYARLGFAKEEDRCTDNSSAAPLAKNNSLLGDGRSKQLGCCSNLCRLFKPISIWKDV